MGTDPLQLCGHLLDGKYLIETFVAKGGFGFVYRGEHVHLKKAIALKVLNLSEVETDAAREEVAAQFHAEAEIVARLVHPAIVPVLDFGVSPMPDGTVAPWMVLEWVPGETLDDDLNARCEADARPRTPREVFDLLRPVLHALAKAHAMGVAHRDIKPRNLMLASVPAERASDLDGPPVKILDFGISKVMNPDEGFTPSGNTVTRSTTVSFTIRYAAPEQVVAMRTGPWTDVYQIALVISELLTQRQPYPDESAMVVRARILSGPRPTPAHLGVDVGAWEPVLAKALAPRPADRYANVRELLDALQEALPGAGPGPASSLEMTLPRARSIDPTVRGAPSPMPRPEEPRPEAPPQESEPQGGTRPRSNARRVAALAVAGLLALLCVALLARSPERSPLIAPGARPLPPRPAAVSPRAPDAPDAGAATVTDSGTGDGAVDDAPLRRRHGRARHHRREGP